MSNKNTPPPQNPKLAGLRLSFKDLHPEEPTPEVVDSRLVIDVAQAEAPYDHDQKSNPGEQARQSENALLRDDNRGVFGLFDGKENVAGGREAAELIKQGFDISLSANVLWTQTSEGYKPINTEEGVLDALETAVLQTRKYFEGQYQNQPPEEQELLEEAGAEFAVGKIFKNVEGKTMFAYAHSGSSTLAIRRADGKLYQLNEYSKPDDDDAVSGMRIGMPFDPDEVEYDVIELEEGDTLLLANTGVVGNDEHDDTPLSADEISAVLADTDPQNAANELLRISRNDADKAAMVIKVSEVGTPTQSKSKSRVAEELRAARAKPIAVTPDGLPGILSSSFWDLQAAAKENDGAVEEVAVSDPAEEAKAKREQMAMWRTAGHVGQVTVRVTGTTPPTANIEDIPLEERAPWLR